MFVVSPSVRGNVSLCLLNKLLHLYLFHGKASFFSKGFKSIIPKPTSSDFTVWQSDIV